MKLLEKLIFECRIRGFNCSITYQHINSYSVEIYKGKGMPYTERFYSDEHRSTKKAIKKGLKYIITKPSIKVL